MKRVKIEPVFCTCAIDAGQFSCRLPAKHLTCRTCGGRMRPDQWWASDAMRWLGGEGWDPSFPKIDPEKLRQLKAGEVSFQPPNKAQR